MLKPEAEIVGGEVSAMISSSFVIYGGKSSSAAVERSNRPVRAWRGIVRERRKARVASPALTALAQS